jgi:serine/threonine-protein kinase
VDSARVKRIQELFLQAAELPEPERAAFVDVACGGDRALTRDVLAMLREDARTGSLLDHGVARLAGEMLAGSPMPDQLGPYRLGGLLGEGGMGVVYLAERADLGSQVAIKFLRDAWLSPARRERFLSEQRTLAQLNHASIARIYDADTLPNGTPWFAMEYVEGLPLTDYCREHNCAPEERLRLFRSVCEAVQYAHEHAIIHRDLKPSNILVKPGGEVKLLDFGIAKQLDEASADQTGTVLRLMTPAYAAPEQIRGERVGVYTDVYSLGVILSELLGENVDSDLRLLSRTALHPDIERRYRSVEALIRDVDHYLRAEPLDAHPDSLGYRAGKFLARNRRTVAVAGVGLAVVLAMVVFFTVRLAAARNAALASAARAQRVQQFMSALFEGGDKEAGPKDGLRVITLVDRGVQEAQLLNREPAVQADLYQTLGNIERTLGNFDRADTLLRAALDERKNLFGSGSREVSGNTVALGLLRIDQAKLDDAEKLAREALEQAKGIRPRDQEAIAKATFAVGKVLEARGQYARAIPVLEDAVKLQSPGLDRLSTLTELANSQFYDGHYDASDALNQEALKLGRELLGPRHPKVADNLVNLGATQKERGNYAEAERLYREALEITQSWYGPDHPETAGMLFMLGNVLNAENRMDEAAPPLEKALAIRERVYGEVNPRVANVLSELGQTALKRGKLDDAEAYFRRILTIYKTVYGDKHYLVGLATANLAGVFVERGQYARAEPMFHEALDRYAQVLPADHLYNGIARIKLGHLLVLEKRYADAERESLAGYRIVAKQASPSLVWLQSGRKDLAAIYEALHQPEKAAEYLAATRPGAPSSPR